MKNGKSAMKKYYLAIDIGASSGRHIVGWLDDGEIMTDEVYRFPNGIKRTESGLIWDTEALVASVKAGISAALTKYEKIESLAIDTWGVDYVLLRGDEEVLPCFAYRDARGDAATPLVHEKIPFEKLYSITGIQYQPFNTVYQLYDDKTKGRLEGVTDFLMMPEYLAYKLTGVKVKEYTNATTTGMINAATLDFDKEIISALGLPEKMFLTPKAPGSFVGMLSEAVASEVGGNLKVMLAASHDTASAVEGIPMEGSYPYVSSGTWSLLGVKSPVAHTDEKSYNTNYSNEGGVGYIRYQKNLMGMWLVNQLQAELCPDKSIVKIVEEARKSSFAGVTDVNTSEFMAPVSMKAAFDEAFAEGEGPRCECDYFACAYRSIAESYRVTLEELKANTGMTYDKLYIVGGGAKNAFLNELVEEACKIKVVALPIEATSLGNLKIQMEADR